jgi:hypothetical protein
MAFLKGNWLLTLEAADLVHFVWEKVCLHFVLNVKIKGAHEDEKSNKIFEPFCILRKTYFILSLLVT